MEGEGSAGISFEVRVTDDSRYPGKMVIFSALERILHDRFPFARVQFARPNWTHPALAITVTSHLSGISTSSLVWEQTLPAFPSQFDPASFIKEGLPKICSIARPPELRPKLSKAQTAEALQRMSVLLMTEDDDDVFALVVKEYSLHNREELEHAIEEYLHQGDDDVRILLFMLRLYLSKKIEDRRLMAPTDGDHYPALLRQSFQHFATHVWQSEDGEDRLTFEEFKELFKACILTANAEQCEREPNSLSEIMAKAGDVWENFTGQSSGKGFTLRCFKDLVTDTCRGPALLAKPSLIVNFGLQEDVCGRFLCEIVFHRDVVDYLDLVYRKLLLAGGEGRTKEEDGLNDTALGVLVEAMCEGEDADEDEKQEKLAALRERFAAITKRRASSSGGEAMKDEGEVESLASTCISYNEWYLYFLEESLGDPSGIREALKNINAPVILHKH